MPFYVPRFCVIAVLLAAPFFCRAQASFNIYSDALASGWLDYSYTITDNFANTAPLHSGSKSISVTINGAYGGIQLYHMPLTNAAYGSLTFWINGGSAGGQQLQVYGNLGSGPTAQTPRYHLNILPANTWQQYTVPLTFLGVANATNFSGFAIQDSTGAAQPTFYLDDIQLSSATAPALVNVSLNATQTVRVADARWFGMNTAIWDAAFDSANTVNQFTNLGTRALRFPGGSLSDEYHWVVNRSLTNTWQWATQLGNFIHVVTNANAQAMITVNYGTGSTNEAAAWVAYVNAATNSTVPLGVDSNGTNWQTAGWWAALRAAMPLANDDGENFLRIGRSTPLGFKYWEIGNECYGDWETDSNSPARDPYTYAVRAKNYLALMKAVDPTIKIGVVALPGEDAYANYSNHPATNPRTGLTHNGWTPVLLATLQSLGATADFLIHHRYPESPGGENDASLLQSSTGWASDAASLRQQITDYVGSSGTNIELVCTENNSVSSSPGKQSTSLVNGLFYADSLAQLMQTEINGLFWWNFRNGGVETNNTSAALYGWRIYGDYGVTEGTNYFPAYYTGRLMQKFVQPGDTVVAAATDYTLLAAYATRRQNGAVSLLVINKDPLNVITGKVAVAGFVPAASAALYVYGISQDDAARTGIGSPDIAQTNFPGAATNFNYAFPPYSASVFTLAPAAVKLASTALLANPSRLVFQMQGQPNVPAIMQTSTDLLNWISVSTNSPASGSLYFTNALSPASPRQFWRAAWPP
jgi:hypothetical protein